ncbi:MAG: LON peptidase substrate-binding domain-containing protein [Pseudomonadota bacterium]
MSKEPQESRNTNGHMPETMPIFPLGGALLLPGGQLPLNIFEPRYLRMVDDALARHRMIGMIQPRETGSNTEKPPLYGIGCAGRLTSFSESDDGRYMITLTGLRRFRVLEELSVDTPYRQITADWSDFAGDGTPDPTAEMIDRERLLAAMEMYLDAEGLKTDWDAVEEAPSEALVVSLAMGCPFAGNEKQALLEAGDMATRAECLIALMEMSSVDDTKTDTMIQ